MYTITHFTSRIDILNAISEKLVFKYTIPLFAHTYLQYAVVHKGSILFPRLIKSVRFCLFELLCLFILYFN